MGRFRIRDRGISARVAHRIRIGIMMGELVFNLVVKEDIKGARKILLKASKSPKHTYLATLHTASRCMKLHYQ